MFRMLGAAVAAVVLSCAGAAGAATYFQLPEGQMSTFYFHAADVAGIEGAEFIADYDRYFNLWTLIGEKEELVTYGDYGYGISWGCYGPEVATCNIRFDGYNNDYYTVEAGFSGANFFVRFINNLKSFDICGTGTLDDNCAVYYQAGVGTFGSAEPYRILTTVVPEPTTWALLVSGFGLSGAALRRSRRQAATVM